MPLPGLLDDLFVNPMNPNAQPAQAQHLTLWDKIQNIVAPPPGGQARGLLSEQDITNARNQGLLQAGASMLADSGPTTAANRVGLGQSIGRGLQAGMGGYQNAVQSQIGNVQAKQANQMNQMKMKAMEQEMGIRGQEQAQSAQLQQVRAGIVQKYGQPDPNDPQGMAHWLDQVIPELSAAGDAELVGRFSEIRKSLGGQQGQKEPGTWVDVPGPNGQPVKKYITASEAGAGVPVYQDPLRGQQRDETLAQLEENRRFNNEQKAGDDFNKDTTLYRQGASKLQGGIDAAPAARAGDPASQINMLYAFVNAMDPQSAVREGEIGLAQAATPFWTRARAMVDKYTSGQSVTVPPAMVESMEQLMRRRYSAYEKAISERQSYYKHRNKKWNIDPDTFPGLTPLSPAAAAAAGVPATGNNPLLK